jgi:hypothetical protein
MSDGIHTCSLYCTRPACVLAQRNEMRDAAPPDHREAMQQALDWLQAEQRAGDEDCGDPGCDECSGATRPRQKLIDALRKALEEK